jgi:hypothetical protein
LEKYFPLKKYYRWGKIIPLRKNINAQKKYLLWETIHVGIFLMLVNNINAGGKCRVEENKDRLARCLERKEKKTACF